ncbi:unnamed protein product, partial [Prorocentrum cordatum]
ALVRETLHWVGLAQVLASSRCPEVPACPPIPSCPALPEIPSCPACPGAPPSPARPSAPPSSGGWALPLAGFSLGGLLVALVFLAAGRWGSTMAALAAPALPSPALEEWAFVLYTVAGPLVYHQRRVLGCRRAACSATELGRVIIGTPDLDVHEEYYRTGSLGVDAARVVFSSERWPPPAAAPRAQAIAGVVAELGAAAGPAPQGAGAGPALLPVPIAAGPAPGAAPAAEPDAAVAPAPPVAVAAQAAGSGPPARAPAIPDGLLVVIPASGLAPLGWSWRALEDLAGLVTHGQVVDVGAPGGPTLGGGAGRRQVALLPSGHSVFVALVADTEVDHLKREFRGSDARALPVMHTAVGRERAWTSVIADCREENIPAFGAKDSDFGVSERETLSKVVEMFGTVGQLDLYNLAGVEVAYRKLQLIEYYWDERRQEQQQANAKMPLDEVQAFLGGGRAASMECPELLEQVSKELERIAGIKKNARKLREEQAALAKK